MLTHRKKLRKVSFFLNALKALSGIASQMIGKRCAKDSPLAGFRRFLAPPKRQASAQPEPPRVVRRGAEKSTHLACRRGGGTTARARCRPSYRPHVARHSPGNLWHATPPRHGRARQVGDVPDTAEPRHAGQQVKALHLLAEALLSIAVPSPKCYVGMGFFTS